METTEITEIILTEAPGITSEDDSIFSTQMDVTTIPEVTTTAVQTEDFELLQSVQNIETLLSYEFGIHIVIIAAFLCSVIIKTFFKGV